MRNILLLLVGSTILVAAPAASYEKDYPFKTYGQCNSWLHWQENGERQGWQDTDYHLTCEQGSDGRWYLVPM